VTERARGVGLRIGTAFDDHLTLTTACREVLAEPILRAAEGIVRALGAGGAVLACGNGGSAAHAQHLVAELVGRFERPRPGWRAVALVADPAVLTSISNDFGYEQVFARQVEALARPRDVLVAISTSGRSANVLAAVCAARAVGCTVIGLTGAAPNPIVDVSDVAVAVPSTDVARVQELHTLLLHAMTGAVEELASSPRAERT